MRRDSPSEAARAALVRELLAAIVGHSRAKAFRARASRRMARRSRTAHARDGGTACTAVRLTCPAAYERGARPVSATPSAQYRLTIRVKIDDAHGALGELTGAIGEAGGVVGAVDLVEVDGQQSLRDIVVDASDREHWAQIISAIEGVSGAQVIDTSDRTFLLHVGGKIEQHNKHPLKSRDDLSMAYTPGVARVCRAIADDEDKAFQYTIKRNTVAVVSDGSAVLGLGDIGPL